MSDTAEPPQTAPVSPWQQLKSDIWLSIIAVAAVAFSHLVTGIYGPGLWIGLAVIYVIVICGYALARFIPVKSLPDLFWISLVAMVVTWPGVPGSSMVRDAIDGLSFLPTITPLMAFAALGLGTKEVDLFKRAGVHFAIISLLVFCGTFLGSAIIANMVLAWMGS
ncbi:MAG: hypothetical protein AAGL90_08325 [Pseudomonadota bacterium]